MSVPYNGIAWHSTCHNCGTEVEWTDEGGWRHCVGMQQRKGCTRPDGSQH